MVTNIVRQPNASMSPVSNGGAIAGPMLPPELYTPVGLPRSLTWNQSLVTRTAPGKAGLSVAPRAMRAHISCV
jgi:hypothetical protein